MKTLKILLATALIAGLSSLTFSQPSFTNPELDRFWIAIQYGDTVPGMNGGFSQIPGQPGEDMRWYFYPNEFGQNPWFNIWFWNGPFLPMNTKNILVGFWIQGNNPTGAPGFFEVVVNWSGPDWSWPDPQPGPPLPPLSPQEEDLYVLRSEVLAQDQVFFGEFIWVEFWYEIPDYNPEWVSIDIWGDGFEIPLDYPVLPDPTSPIFPYWIQFFGPGAGLMVHECIPPDQGQLFEFGDAPDQSLAYLDGTIGLFPTCMNVLNTLFVSHACPTPIFLGGWVDCEPDGNAGWCPFFHPNTYDRDECGTFPYPTPPAGIVDEGLIYPVPVSIIGPAGGESYVPCGQKKQALDTVCRTAIWGQNIDIWVEVPAGAGAFLNVLFDWNQDGVWALDPGTQCQGNVVPEHVIVDHFTPGCRPETFTTSFARTA